MSKEKTPSYEKCLTLMRKRNPQLAEDGFHWLLPHVELYVDELIQSFESEKDHGLRCWLLELIGEARADEAFEVLSQQALSTDESFSSWGKRELRMLDTKKARTFLYNNNMTL